MPQFARPSADTNNPDGWTDQGGGGTNLFQTIDEASPSDADYIRSVPDPTSDVFVTKLSNITDPSSSSGHIMRWRRGKDPSSGGAQIDLTVQLRQGYVNEGTPGTLIKTVSDNDIPGAFTDTSATLSSGEADAITDYTALYLRIVANKP